MKKALSLAFVLVMALSLVTSALATSSDNVSEDNLVVGTTYAIKISSTTVPSEGCNGRYILTTF